MLPHFHQSPGLPTTPSVLVLGPDYRPAGQPLGARLRLSVIHVGLSRYSPCGLLNLQLVQKTPEIWPAIACCRETSEVVHGQRGGGGGQPSDWA
jgi:hypothetical protein